MELLLKKGGRRVHTHTVGPFENVPKQDVVIQKVEQIKPVK